MVYYGAQKRQRLQVVKLQFLVLDLRLAGSCQVRAVAPYCVAPLLRSNFLGRGPTWRDAGTHLSLRRIRRTPKAGGAKYHGRVYQGASASLKSTRPRVEPGLVLACCVHLRPAGVCWGLPMGRWCARAT